MDVSTSGGQVPSPIFFILPPCLHRLPPFFFSSTSTWKRCGECDQRTFPSSSGDRGPAIPLLSSQNLHPISLTSTQNFPLRNERRVVSATLLDPLTLFFPLRESSIDLPTFLAKLKLFRSPPRPVIQGARLSFFFFFLQKVVVTAPSSGLYSFRTMVEPFLLPIRRPPPPPLAHSLKTFLFAVR